MGGLTADALGLVIEGIGGSGRIRPNHREGRSQASESRIAMTSICDRQRSFLNIRDQKYSTVL
jgi:hypothetical protein